MYFSDNILKLFLHLQVCTSARTFIKKGYGDSFIWHENSKTIYRQNLVWVSNSPHSIATIQVSITALYEVAFLTTPTPQFLEGSTF